MAYCKKCGKQVADGSSVCLYCGYQQVHDDEWNRCAIVGFTLVMLSIWLSVFGIILAPIIFPLGFICLVIGIVVSANGVHQTRERHQRGKTLGLCGFIIGEFVAITGLVIFIVMSDALLNTISALFGKLLLIFSGAV